MLKFLFFPIKTNNFLLNFYKHRKNTDKAGATFLLTISCALITNKGITNCFIKGQIINSSQHMKFFFKQLRVLNYL